MFLFSIKDEPYYGFGVYYFLEIFMLNKLPLMANLVIGGGTDH